MDRIFNGALSLLGILLAIFTYTFVQYNSATLRSLAEPYLFLSIWFAALIVACGSLGLLVHIRCGQREPIWFFISFAALLFFSTITPVLIPLFMWLL